MQVLVILANFALTATYTFAQWHQFSVHETALVTASTQIATTLRESAVERSVYAHCHDHSITMQRAQASALVQQREALAKDEARMASLNNENFVQALFDPVL